MDSLDDARLQRAGPADGDVYQRDPGRGRAGGGRAMARQRPAAACRSHLRGDAPLLRHGLQRPTLRVRDGGGGDRVGRPVGGRDHQPRGRSQHDRHVDPGAAGPRAARLRDSSRDRPQPDPAGRPPGFAAVRSQRHRRGVGHNRGGPVRHRQRRLHQADRLHG